MTQEKISSEVLGEALGRGSHQIRLSVECIGICQDDGCIGRHRIGKWDIYYYKATILSQVAQKQPFGFGAPWV